MSETTTIPGAGLFTTAHAHQPVPLTGVSIDADLRSFYAKVVVSQRYVNREATPIEAVYVFPLDEGAAVTAFEAVVGDTLVVGEVHEREDAFEIYDDAMTAGHGAFLLDEERSDVFQASIGNLPPGREVLVRLTYVTELPVNEGRLRFVIPTTVSPRYAPAEDRTGMGRPDSEALNPPVAWSVPYGLSLSVRVTMPGGLAGVESPSHPISVRLQDAGAEVTLGQKEATLDRDFVLSIDAAGLDSPQALVERADDGTEAIGVAFAPAFRAAAAASEVVFVVDRSGSMEGSSIEEVRNALQLCLRSLSHGCRFNIVGFGSHYETLFPESREYSQSTLADATAHVTALQADLGGTEILPALQFVLTQGPVPGLPRQVVVLTDGEVTNTDAVIALASAHAATARIFTFGIGAGASHHLVKGLARAGGGTAEFIFPGERIEPTVLRQLARLLSPALTDVRIEWHGGTVTQAPGKVPPVFAGGRLSVYGFVKDGRPSSVRLVATGPTGPVSFEVPVPEPSAGSSRTVSSLAARARIRELEEGDWAAARGSRQQGRKADAARSEIIALSLRYGLISRETSFVAVERRETPVEGDVQLRRVPIALTSGWGGRQAPREMLRSMRRPASPAGGSMDMDMDMDMLQAPEASPARASRWGGAFLDRFAASSGGVFQPRARAGARMRELILLQSADGSWELTRDLAALIGKDFATLQAAIRGASGPEAEVRAAWATALAITWLRLNAADAEDEWWLLAEKAAAWLASVPAAPPGGGSWTSAAERIY